MRCLMRIGVGAFGVGAGTFLVGDCLMKFFKISVSFDFLLATKLILMASQE